MRNTVQADLDRTRTCRAPLERLELCRWNRRDTAERILQAAQADVATRHERHTAERRRAGLHWPNRRRGRDRHGEKRPEQNRYQRKAQLAGGPHQLLLLLTCPARRLIPPAATPPTNLSQTLGRSNGPTG